MIILLYKIIGGLSGSRLEIYGQYQFHHSRSYSVIGEDFTCFLTTSERDLKLFEEIDLPEN